MTPIAIYKGDATDAFDARVIRINLTTALSLTNATAVFALLSFKKSFTNAEVLTKTFTIAIPSSVTKGFPLGMIYGRITLYDSSLRPLASSVIPFDVKLPHACGGRCGGDSVCEYTVVDGYDYAQSYNKPTINGVEVSGSKSLSDYGIAGASALANEVARATAAETALGTQITNEVSRAEGSEAALGVLITTEQAARIAADTLETNRATAAEQANTASINAVSSRVTSIESKEAGWDAKITDPGGRQADYVLKVQPDGQSLAWAAGGSGVNSYADLINKPKINNHELAAGNNTLDTLGIQAKINGIGNIVTHNVSEFATSAQGTKADNSVQKTGQTAQTVEGSLTVGAVYVGGTRVEVITAVPASPIADTLYFITGS